MAKERDPYIKGMDDAALAEFIAEMRKARAVWDGMALPGMSRGYRAKVAGGFFRVDRLLDIAIAVKRSRERAGNWNPDPAPPAGNEAAIRAEYAAIASGDFIMDEADYNEMAYRAEAAGHPPGPDSFGRHWRGEDGS